MNIPKYPRQQVFCEPELNIIRIYMILFAAKNQFIT